MSLLFVISSFFSEGLQGFGRLGSAFELKLAAQILLGCVE